MFTRAQSGRVIKRCHNSPRWETGLAPKERGGFWEILKKSVSRVKNWTPNETVDFCLLAETFVAGATRDGVGEDR